MKTRIKYINHIIVCFLLILTLVACDSPDELTPTPVIECRRTVLVYQVANNNLGTSRYNEMDITEMREGASNGLIPVDGRLLVYNAGPNAKPLLLEILHDKVDTLKVYDNSIYSVTSERMLEVFDDVSRFAPSDELGLVLWSHGSGWLQDGIEEEPEIATLSFGSEKGNTMNISTLAQVLTGINRLSFLYFDCCYMASIETFYELRNVAPVIIGSATELLVYGMPYEQNIGHFFSDTDALIEAAKNTFNLYDGMLGSSRTCTMSVVDTRYLDALANATAEIYDKASPVLPKDFKPQRFMSLDVKTCLYFDMEQYVRALCLNSDNTPRFEGAEELYQRYKAALDKCILYEASTPRLWNEVDLEYHCGLSTFIVDDVTKLTHKNYNTLEWYNDVVSKFNF